MFEGKRKRGPVAKNEKMIWPQRPYLEEVAFEDTTSEDDSLSSISMEDDLMPDKVSEQPNDGMTLRGSTMSELSRSETKYFEAGE